MAGYGPNLLQHFVNSDVVQHHGGFTLHYVSTMSAKLLSRGVVGVTVMISLLYFVKTVHMSCDKAWAYVKCNKARTFFSLLSSFA